MSSQNPARGQTSRGPKEKEVQADPPRGRTEVAGQHSHGERAHHGRADSRSVSRGRTHGKHHHQHGHEGIDLPYDSFMYPGPGGFSPKGRPLTAFEAAFLSDAPHLDYNKTPTHKKSRSSGGPKSPQMSHIKREMAAAAEAAGARGEASGEGKAPKEDLKKD